MKNYVAYYRVSTEDQGKSGLGLEAQREAVTGYISKNGQLVGEFQDVESGTSETRIGMLSAIEACMQNNATLVVKEMSRITRGSFKFRDMLESAGIDFIECYAPNDTTFIKDIKFSQAREERRVISERSSSALQVIKKKIASGEVHISKTGNVVTSLGSPQNLTDKSRERSIEVRKNKAYNNPDNVKAGVLIKYLKESGENWAHITRVLNESGFKTSRGNNFSEVQTKRLYDRYKQEK